MTLKSKFGVWIEGLIKARLHSSTRREGLASMQLTGQPPSLRECRIIAGVNDQMIELFAAPTPNGVKAAIALRVMDLPHRVSPVKLGPGDKPEGFAAASATGKIPAIIDHDTGTALCESAAILIYLAEKAGSPLLPEADEARARALEWLMIASATIGPALAGAHHYLHFQKGKAPYAEERARGDVARAYKLLEKTLSARAYLAGDAMTLGDVALWPFIARFEWQGVTLDEYPAVRAWYLRLADTPAFAAGFDLAGDGRKPPKPQSAG